MCSICAGLTPPGAASVPWSEHEVAVRAPDQRLATKTSSVHQTDPICRSRDLDPVPLDVGASLGLLTLATTGATADTRNRGSKVNP